MHADLFKENPFTYNSMVKTQTYARSALISISTGYCTLVACTDLELREYNGQDPEKPVLISAGGSVFNVWTRRDLYGADGPYNIFAGRDATRLLAKGVLEPEPEEEQSKSLSFEERESLADWIAQYETRYVEVGKLKDWDPVKHGLPAVKTQ